MAEHDVSRLSAFANGYVSGCIETMTMVAETLRDSSNLPHAVLRASMILKRMRNDPDELRRRIYAMIDGGASSVDDPRDAEIAQLRADLARMTRALADERAAVAIAHERIAEVTAERDARPEISRVDARRYIEWRDGFSPHPANVDRLEPVDDALRAHAAGSGKGGS